MDFSAPSHVSIRLVVASFVFAFALSALPMPDWATLWRPPWVALVLLFWALHAPERAGVFVGWMCGLLLDVLAGTLIGQHALALALVAWLGQGIRRHVRLSAVWEWGLAVFLVMVIGQLVVSGVTSLRGRPVDPWIYLSVPAAGLLVSPSVFFLLRRPWREVEEE